MRKYMVYGEVVKPGMVNTGKRFAMHASPLTHDEACTLMSKLTDYSWRRLFLVEV